MQTRASRTIVLDRGTPEEKRAEIRAYFHQSFTLDEQLYETLSDDAVFFLRPEPLRHPLIFYLGHTACFYINKLIVAGIITERVDPSYEALFAIGVDEMSWDDLSDERYDWPTVDAVRAYRDRVRELVDGIIARLPLSLPITWDHPWWTIMMGIEHQRIHLETSSVIIRRLPLNRVRPLPLWDICPETGEPPENRLLPVAGGTVVLGKPRDHRLYGWDNEYGQHRFTVEDFAASQYLVSNRAYLAFVEAGGYHDPDLWTPEGQQWLEYSHSERPLFWIVDGKQYRLRTMAQEIAMPWDWPVEVNYLEAKAFCTWQALITGEPIRLPTEDEWYLLHDRHAIPDQPDWDQAPGNINLEHWASSCPVTRFPFRVPGSDDAQPPFYDLIGNVWQWTETPISGFDGFTVHPSYDDFSTPTFDTQHNLIKGGSWISTGNEATRDSRYAFRRHFFQHAGLRFVSSHQPLPEPEAMYETDAAVAQYCHAHYGPDAFGVANYPAAMARICIAAGDGRPQRRALDLGCAVGRASFELATAFEEVTGIDFSARFLRIAFQLQEKGIIHYQLPEEGEVVSFHERRLDELGLAAVADRCTFAQGDAHNLKAQFSDYDLVVAANLIDRLYQPAVFLQAIHERIVPGGLLVISSPYSWDTTFTAQEHWLGGYRHAGEPVSSLEGLHAQLDDRFRLLGEPQDQPFVVRETARKFQHSIAQVTIWQRR